MLLTWGNLLSQIDPKTTFLHVSGKNKTFSFFGDWKFSWTPFMLLTWGNLLSQINPKITFLHVSGKGKTFSFFWDWKFFENLENPLWSNPTELVPYRTSCKMANAVNPRIASIHRNSTRLLFCIVGICEDSNQSIYSFKKRQYNLVNRLQFQL